MGSVDWHLTTSPPPPRLPRPLRARGSVSNCKRLAALPTAGPIARCFTAVQLHTWNLHDLADDCALVTSELVTNAVNATGPSSIPAGYLLPGEHPVAAIVLRLRLTPERLLCESWDSSQDPPLPANPDELDYYAVTGRGLLLVAAYSTDWGYYYPARGSGKIVWVAFDIAPDRPRT